MGNADAVIAVLRNGHNSLAESVSGFSDDDLARPSGAADWDVSQVLSHLGSGAEIFEARLRAAVDDSDYPAADLNQGIWDRWNAMTRRERVDGFLRANETLVALYESLDATTCDKLSIDMGFLPEPVDVATSARLRLSEFALHAWDVAVAFDQHAALPPDAAAALLHAKPDMLAWVGRADALEGRTAVIHVTTSDPGSVFVLRLQAPISVEFDLPEQSEGTLRLPAEAWLRLVAGRLTDRYTPDSVIAKGDADLELLRRVFPGY
ncbi:maleylpyruvate isomerase family mycothiol-dependent enzyme [Streptomyces sp. NPDC058457]|uniref:maleylpyruvate isomerase family mycothiol-dependent enzyme n=1 Tax=Streptomyces sp. NPDC058457 TaxID=3346507 RepID=UPI0036660CC9